MKAFVFLFFIVIPLSSIAKVNANVLDNSHAIRLALNWKAEPQFGGFYAAELNGEFKKRNLQVEIIEGGSGTPTIQMLANNKIEFAIVGGEEILLLMDRNSQTRIIPLFATYQVCPVMIMSHKQRAFKNLNEVFSNMGLLAVQSGLPYYSFLMHKYGAKKQVKVVPYFGGIANFQQDIQFSQQGFITSEAIVAKNLGIQISTFLLADEGYNPYTTVLAVNEVYAKSHRAEVLALVDAIRAGWQAYLKDPGPVNKRMSELNKGLTLETFRQSAEAQKKLIENAETQRHGLGYMSEARWQELSEQLKMLGLIKTKTPVLLKF